MEKGIEEFNKNIEMDEEAKMKADLKQKYRGE